MPEEKVSDNFSLSATNNWTTNNVATAPKTAKERLKNIKEKHNLLAEKKIEEKVRKIAVEAFMVD